MKNIIVSYFSGSRNLGIMLKGMIIGGTMLVPGVSGGTMAMILGIYDELIGSVSSFMKHKGESFRFLLLFTAGGSLGMFLFSHPILYLIERFTMPALFFFMGAVAGGVPFIFRKAELKRFSWRGTLYIAAGIAIVITVSAIPVNGSDTEMAGDMKSSLFLAAAGIAAAAALVLPGISVSYLLLIMGLYDETMAAISQVYTPFLIPLATGLVLGIIMTSKLLERAMLRFPQPAYLMILGFVLGSLEEVFPGLPRGGDIPLCLLTFSVGALAILRFSLGKHEKKPAGLTAD